MQTSVDTHAPAPATSGRLAAIDLLRGLTIGFMILVNNSHEQAWWPFKHADWNGFTPTDLVFPTFLFLVGVSIAYSTAARLAQGATRAELFGHIVRRSIILYLLGLVVNSFPFFHLDTMRYYGVLPRIAICYLIVASLHLLSPAWRSKLVLAVVALLGYWVLMRCVPVPGYGVPGHDVPLLDPDRNLAAWLDRQVFSAPHLYERTRDPEGLLSTIPALATALLGLLTGYWLRSGRTLAQKVKGIAVVGIGCLLLAGLWNIDFPINKKLWTSSYVLFAGGWSLLLLAFFLWIADLRRAGADRAAIPAWHMPLLVFGTNSIFAYVLAELFQSLLGVIHAGPGLSLAQWLYAPLLSALPNGGLAALVYSLLFVAVCWLPVYALYRRGIFIKI